ncbi:MAG: hypothetical protein IPI67_20495 [Myxococcales bacterium]|nr:hypothetical protein [Myxococcales bacterium]
MRYRALAGLVLTVVLSGCPKNKDSDSLTFAEAQQAVEESTLSSQAESLQAASVEITTNFSIGQAVQNAAQEIQTFVATQMPCADITLADATLTVNYGAKPGNCTYKGHTFKGSHSINVQKNEDAQVLVHHEWTDFSNGNVKLNGTADVTWDLQVKSRHVVHSVTWTRVLDDFKVTGEGDRTQTVLAGGLLEGIKVDGTRSWSSTRGEWDMTIDGVEMRWIDPVPQAGSYKLLTPSKKQLSLSFERVDEDTIQVTVANGSRSFHFNVTKLGSVKGTS